MINMREILRNIIYMGRRFKLATTLNFIGLVVAFASFYLLMTQVIYQTTYNRGIDDHERIYRLESDYVFNEWQWSDAMCRPFADALTSLPGIEQVSLLSNKMGPSGNMKCVKGDTVVEFPFAMGNNTALSALTHAVDGNIEWTDDDRTGAIIPESVAQAYFGTTQAAGKELVYEGGLPIKVRGVYRDFPDNSLPENAIVHNLGDIGLDDYNFMFTCLVKVKEGTDPNNLIESLKDAILKTMGEHLTPEQIGTKDSHIQATNFQFTPIDDTYFAHGSQTFSETGYRSMLYILELASLLIIIVAAINCLNFTLAESPMRIRSLNVRRVMGASRLRLRAGIVAECVIVSCLAFAVAMGVCYLIVRMLPYRQLMEGDITLSHQWPLVLFTLLIAIAVGIVAGFYPAVFATSHKPAMVLKGSFGLTPQGRKLRRLLVALQLFVSFYLITYIGILFMQDYYIYNSQYGYDKNRVLYTSLTPSEIDYRDLLRQELMKLPEVESAGFSSFILGANDTYNNVCLEDSTHFMRVPLLFVDFNYLRTMGIRVVEGRDFTEDDDSGSCCIINEAARDKWDWIEMGKPLDILDGTAVVGVCENIRYGSTRIDNEQPIMFVNTMRQPNWLLNVRVAPGANRTEAQQRIAQTVTAIGGEAPQQIMQLDETLKRTYEKEFRFVRQVFIISIICMIITLVGVFCLTLFETEFRRKEIGIRKVAGATTGNIVKALCRRYLPIILWSFALAAPLACYSGWLTLQYFSQHTAIYWWLFPLSLLLVGGITLCTVALQSWRTARENPVNSIRTSD